MTTTTEIEPKFITMTTTTEIEPKWYTVRVQGQYENKIAEYLKSDARRNHINLTVNIPYEKNITIIKGKKIIKDKVKMPGYIFVQIEEPSKLIYMLRGVNGAMNVLCDRNKIPIPLRDKEVEDITSINKKKEDNKIEDLYIVGELVNITSGVYENMQGTIESLNYDLDEIKLSIKIFGKPIKVKASFNEIKKID